MIHIKSFNHLFENVEYYKKIKVDDLLQNTDWAETRLFDRIIFDKEVSIKLQNLLFDIVLDFEYNTHLVSFNTKELGVDIYACEDEWFLVTILYFSTSESEFSGQQHYYKCDQYEGLIELINDKIIKVK